MRDDVELPVDSSAAVVSNGLLGGKYLALVPGGDVEMLEPGDEVRLTQSAINLEDLIGHVIFNRARALRRTGGRAERRRPGSGRRGPGRS